MHMRGLDNPAGAPHILSNPGPCLSNAGAGNFRAWRTALFSIACLGLGSCGGGGGGGGNGNAPVSAAQPAPAPVSAALSKYTGVWYGPCQGRIQDTATLAAAANANALQLNLVRNFHDGAGCTGNPIASETLSADFTLAYGSTGSAPAVLVPGGAASQVALDLVTISIPAYTRTRSGAAATTTEGSGGRTWCVNYADGPVCTADPGPQAAASAAGALYLDNGELVLLSPAGSGYLADSRYTRERAVGSPNQGPAFARIDTVQGTGALATSGRTLTVHYTGWLYDAGKADLKGVQFDSSAGKAPFRFRLGASQVIAGWDQGLLGMRAGGKRTLVIPAALAYGRAGSGSTIPPDAALVFDVELIGVE